jgi:hypothetical protein
MVKTVFHYFYSNRPIVSRNSCDKINRQRITRIPGNNQQKVVHVHVSRLLPHDCSHPSTRKSSVARWRFSLPDLDNSGGFESCLAGIFYFCRVPNFWRISGGFDQFCTGLFLSDRSGGILAVFESLLTKKAALFKLFLTNFFNEKKITKKIAKKIGKKKDQKIYQKKIIFHMGHA